MVWRDADAFMIAFRPQFGDCVAMKRVGRRGYLYVVHVSSNMITVQFVELMETKTGLTQCL